MGVAIMHKMRPVSETIIGFKNCVHLIIKTDNKTKFIRKDTMICFLEITDIPLKKVFLTEHKTQNNTITAKLINVAGEYGQRSNIRALKEIILRGFLNSIN